MVSLEEGACAATIADMEARATAIRNRVFRVVNARVASELSVWFRVFRAMTSSFTSSFRPSHRVTA
jgi:hypothetical protein